MAPLKNKCYIVSGMVKGLDGKIEFVQIATTTKKDREFVKEFFKESVDKSQLVLIGDAYILEIKESEIRDIYQAVCLQNTKESINIDSNVVYGVFGTKEVKND